MPIYGSSSTHSETKGVSNTVMYSVILFAVSITPVAVCMDGFVAGAQLSLMVNEKQLYCPFFCHHLTLYTL